MSFWDFSEFCRFCSQMSELLNLRCPDVILWWFPGTERAFEKKIKWSFRWPRTCRKMSFWDFSQFCKCCSQMSELLHYRCPDVILWWFPAIKRAYENKKKLEVFHDHGPAEKCQFATFHMFADFVILWRFPAIKRAFEKKKKKWSFRWLRTYRKMLFWDFSQFCRFCSQMSKSLHFRCPGVILWWFPAIKRAFEKFKKIEVFDDRGQTCRQMSLGDISQFCRFCSQMIELLHFTCPGVILWWFLAMKRAFEKIKKLKFSMTADLQKNVVLDFSQFYRFAAKWVNYYILGVLVSYYDDFQPFKGLLRNSKKLKFSMTADLEKNVIFGLFTCMQILQPNEWIITF